MEIWVVWSFYLIYVWLFPLSPEWFFQLNANNLSKLIPDSHLLRRIPRAISFDFIYELLEPYYPPNGRPSVDPVSMFKMLLVGYLYGIKSERRLVQEVQLNIAYRWFCGFELSDRIPDHSTFSKTRQRKWNESCF